MDSRSSIHGSGNIEMHCSGRPPVEGDASHAAQQAIHQFETDPEWTKGQYIWTAVLDSRTCPVCIGQDGTERREGEPGPFWDGSCKIDPHPNCRCYLIPITWRGEENRRLVVGDSGEQVVPFRTDVEDWLRANPQTTIAIFGEEIGVAFLGRSRNGLPIPPIPLAWAVQRWTERQEDLLAPMLIYEKKLREAKEFYRRRGEEAFLEKAIESLEACVPLVHSALESYKHHDSQCDAGGEVERYGEAFKQLAVIYEKQGRLIEALSVCQAALDAGWGGDWDHRMERLQRRIAKASKP